MSILTSEALFRRLFFQWGLLLLIALAATGWLASRDFVQLNASVYDRLIAWSDKPVNDDILIVAVDDRSLREIGRWPWSRLVHAALVDRLREAGVQAVMMDILFLEAEGDGKADRRLGDAMARAGNVYVPLARAPMATPGAPPVVYPPLPDIADNAAGIGHINVEADLDGKVRRLYLCEGVIGQVVPHLTWALFDSLASKGLATGMAMPGEEIQSIHNTPSWHRDHLVRVPFRGSPGAFPRVSYSSVLLGEVPDELLKDRIVLVGATASGLGDRYAVPVSGRMGTMAGVEIQANLLNGLMDGYVITELGKAARILLSMVPVLALMIALLVSRMRYVHALMALMVGLTMAACALALRLGIWWPPAASLTGLVLFYLLWQWRSQSVILRWFSSEIESLSSEPNMVPEAGSASRMHWGSTLHRRVMALEAGVQQLRASRRFVTDMLDSLPVVTFLVNGEAKVKAANRKARWLVGNPAGVESWKLRDALLTVVPADAVPVFLSEGGRFADVRHWHGQAFFDRWGNHYRIEVAPLWTAITLDAGWLISLVDMTGERRAAEQRAHMLRFLSHDMKAPQASMLALLDMQNGTAALPAQEFHARLERQVRSALDMIEDFMQLAKVEFGALDFREVLLANIAMDALDRAWPLAQAKGIRLESDNLDDDGGPIWGDQGFLVRAVFNLLENAIKYSPPRSVVTLSVLQSGDRVICQVSDQGVGIASHDIPYLFESYRRFDADNMATGLGLGLAFVKTVMDKHNGEIQCRSVVRQGSTFTLNFPAYADAGD
ncbi:CHASE2 and HATPase_c domain-containing protein [Alloalcanivorax xenomutans]|uniref:CHASE2 and HATPase_c domain-containing protein n=1 Tax=Alloalcanivorax xenomutans TaxID=1094342 RepID=UPI0024E1F04F|nr:CHASE2 and HATPase_c domain-containing protein [Alloalcanivorax xenomutans]